MPHSDGGFTMSASKRLISGLGLTVLAAFFLGACAPGKIEDSPPPIGDFRLGHIIVSEKSAEQAPISREAEAGLLQTEIEEALQERLGRYKGGKWYHLAVSIGAYSLSGGGIPVVASPRSAIIVEVTVWDDAAAAKLNEEPRVFTVIEPTSPATIFGSGLVRTPEEQANVLAVSAADLVEKWLRSPESPLPGVGETN